MIGPLECRVSDLKPKAAAKIGLIKDRNAAKIGTRATRAPGKRRGT